LSRINWDAVWQSLNWGSADQQDNVEQTLAQRAEKYARLQESEIETADENLKVLVFTQGQERYAIPVSFVQQGMSELKLTPLPCVPTYYRGVINLRGRILSVLDLRCLWGLPAQDVPGLARVIVVRAGALELALLAEDVVQMLSIPLQKIVPPVVAGVGLPHVQGVSPDGLVIVDIESLASDRRLRVHEELG